MKAVIAIVALLVIVGFGLMFYWTRGPDVSQFEHLKDPAISPKNAQKMLVVKATGDPNVVGQDAFGLLFDIYYKIDGVPKSLTPPAPRTRWPLALDTPKEQWIGLYALPVPATTSALPAYKEKPRLEVALTTWEYGEVAEVLHMGPYTTEEPTVNRLKDFVGQQRYAIVGEHEEEYIKGPGMFGKGNPDKYLTIIRYRVSRTSKP
ncbi:MAG: hypothetical protein FD165_566 [Gammaproteobacteria bacterium]|nr:MAG: hypothetical protein FD165_566 [Gammaproteobacteria bacterium]TND02172.1 MAG: hypothetical protein FD120_2336 [Gammaproteobacteria bacterium]